MSTKAAKASINSKAKAAKLSKPSAAPRIARRKKPTDVDDEPSESTGAMNDAESVNIETGDNKPDDNDTGREHSDEEGHSKKTEKSERSDEVSKSENNSQINSDSDRESLGEKSSNDYIDEDDYLDGLSSKNVINVTTAQAVEALETCSAKDVQKFKNSITRTELQRKSKVPAKERNAHIREDLQLKIDALLEGHPHMLTEMGIHVDPVESIPWKSWGNSQFFKVLLRILKGAKAKTELANRGIMFLNDFVASAAKIQLTGYKAQLDSLMEARDKLYMQHGAVTQTDREDLVTPEQYRANKSKLMKILNFSGANGFMLLVHQEISDLSDKIKTFSQWCRAVKNCYYKKVDQTDAVIALRENHSQQASGGDSNINGKRKAYDNFQKSGVKKFTSLSKMPEQSGESQQKSDTIDCKVCGSIHNNAPCRF